MHIYINVSTYRNKVTGAGAYNIILLHYNCRQLTHILVVTINTLINTQAGVLCTERYRHFSNNLTLFYMNGSPEFSLNKIHTRIT